MRRRPPSLSRRGSDDLFRFKVDFVRRRALPLLKGGAHVARSPEDDAIVEALIVEGIDKRRELAMPAPAAPFSMKKEGQPPAPSPQPRIGGAEAMVRRARHDRAFRDWVIFRFPENVEPFHLVEVEHPAPQLPRR